MHLPSVISRTLEASGLIVLRTVEHHTQMPPKTVGKPCVEHGAPYSHDQSGIKGSTKALVMRLQYMFPSG